MLTSYGGTCQPIKYTLQVTTAMTKPMAKVSSTIQPAANSIMLKLLFCCIILIVPLTSFSAVNVLGWAFSWFFVFLIWALWCQERPWIWIGCHFWLPLLEVTTLTVHGCS